MNEVQFITILLAVARLAYSSCEHELLIPYDEQYGEAYAMVENDGHKEMKLAGPYHLFGMELSNTTFIYENGVVSFGHEIINQSSNLPLADFPTLIAGFWTDLTTPKPSFYTFFYSEMIATMLPPQRVKYFDGRRLHIMCLLNKGFGTSISNFNLTNMFVITWDNSLYCDTETVKFQITLVSDSNSGQTYALLLYDKVEMNNNCETAVNIGFNAGDGKRSYIHPLSNNMRNRIELESTVGRPGAYVYRTDQYNIEPATELKLRFMDNTPTVVWGDTVQANFTLSRDYSHGSPRMICTVTNRHNNVKRTQVCELTGLEGTVTFYDLPATLSIYTLQVTAYDDENKIILKLKGKVRVYGTQECDYCGVHFINTVTERLNARIDYIEFVLTGATKYFSVLLDGTTILTPNKSLSICDQVRQAGDETKEPAPTGDVKLQCRLFLNTTDIEMSRRKRHTLIVKPETYQYSEGGYTYNICKYAESRIKMRYKFYIL